MSWSSALGLGVVGLLAMPAIAAPLSNDRVSPPSALPPLSPSRQLARKFTCPTDLESLTTALLRDLPGYINRANLRLVKPKTATPTYAVVASQPDFTPLPTGSSEYQSPQDKNLHQVFFTVLERQYAGRQVIQFQQYHWLFLTQTADGWRLALLFSHIGSYPRDRQPITPPRESSQGATADAIRAWLRNCEAGSIKP